MTQRPTYTASAVQAGSVSGTFYYKFPQVKITILKGSYLCKGLGNPINCPLLRIYTVDAERNLRDCAQFCDANGSA